MFCSTFSFVDSPVTLSSEAAPPHQPIQMLLIVMAMLIMHFLKVPRAKTHLLLLTATPWPGVCTTPPSRSLEMRGHRHGQRSRCRFVKRQGNGGLTVLCDEQNKEKERLKEREREAREREARSSNGHLFTSLTVSSTTLCSSCKRSITAKEALSCPGNYTSCSKIKAFL